MLKKKGFSTSFPNEDLIDNNQETISNFKIKKEDFLLDFDDTYEQLNMATPKGKIIIQGQENHSPFSLKSFSNLSFDYNRPLSPKTHILNIQDNNNNNNYSPILKRVNKTISPSLVSSTNRFKNSFSCSSSSPSSSSSSSSSSSPRLISTPPIISTPSSPMILTSSLDKFDEILSENEFMSLDNSVTSSTSSSSSPIIIKTNTTTTSTKIVTPSSSPSSSYIEDAPSTPSPSKLFQSLSFKSPCSSPSSSSSTTTTTTPKSSINGGNIIKKQLFSNKRIQDIKIEKPSTKIDLHPSKLQIKSNLKIKPSLPYNSTEVTANTKTTTTLNTTTNTTIPTLSKNIIKRTSSVGLSPTLSSTQLVNKSSRKSISATTTTTTTTIPPHNNNNNNNSTTTTKTPSKRSLDTSNLSTPKSTSSTINKAFTTSTTPLKKPRMSMTPLSSSSSTTPSKFINPLPSSSSSSKTTTTITNSKRLSTLSKPSPITPITPTPTITKTTTTATTTPNKPTNKRLSTLVNTAQKPRKSYAPPPSSHIPDELEQRIQEALLAEANGNYTGGSVLTHSSPQKVEQSEWSPIRKKSTLHDVHACTKKNY
ncbi:hypothetical protein ACTFIR_005145 [Dictyostelium discoideum]